MSQPPSLYERSMAELELFLLKKTIDRLAIFMSPMPWYIKKCFIKKLTSWKVWSYRAFDTDFEEGLQAACLGRLADFFDRLDDLRTSEYLHKLRNFDLENTISDKHDWNKWPCIVENADLVCNMSGNYQS
jgi:hypothetical protein